VNWDVADFAVAAALLIGAGLMYVLASRTLDTSKYRAVAGIALVAALLLVWAELAVGVLGTPIGGQ
jgi:hypothetical protein